MNDIKSSHKIDVLSHLDVKLNEIGNLYLVGLRFKVSKHDVIRLVWREATTLLAGKQASCLQMPSSDTLITYMKEYGE